MKKIIALCMMVMLVGGLAFSQAQDPGFSNTLYTGFGNTDPIKEGPEQGETDFLFQGFANYFTANVDIGKVTLAGDIIWKMGFDGGFSTNLLDWNFNVVVEPFKGFDVGLGTNLEWEVGPAPTSGPRVSAYNVPYYAGLGERDQSLSGKHLKHNAGSTIYENLGGAGTVNNFFANRSLAVRYAYEDLIQVGVALNTLEEEEDEFSVGIGVKANIVDLFTIGVAYNGDFQTSKNNSIYVGSSITAIKNVPIDIWMNFIPNGKKSDIQKGQNTFGGRIGFFAGAFYIAPEVSVTIWNKKDRGFSMYAALDTYMSITSEMLLGLNASWGLGSDPDIDNDSNKAGARLNINPYFIWNINETNKVSVGAHIMPVWWQTKVAGDRTNFYWSIPIAWRVSF